VAPRREPQKPLEELFNSEGESAEGERRRRMQEQEERKKRELEERQRVLDCEALIKQATEQKDKGDYKTALNTLSKAESLKVAAQTKTISALREDIKQLKKDKGIFGKLGNLMKTVDSIMGDD
jgi:hypothetical protein